MAKKYSSGGSGKGMNAAMGVIVAAVLALGAFAVYGSVHTSKLQDKLNNYNATIAQRADALGMEAEDFLSLYGLGDSGLKASDSEQTAYEKMTLANYVKYNTGVEFTEDALKEFKEAMADELDGLEVSMDTTDLSVKSLYSMYAQQKSEEAQQAQQAQEMPAVEEVSEEPDNADESAE